MRFDDSEKSKDEYKAPSNIDKENDLNIEFKTKEKRYILKD